MNPQEYAKNLVNKFYNTKTHPNSVIVRHEIAKKCAKLCVLEIILAIGFSDNIEYYEQVLKEIELL